MNFIWDMTLQAKRDGFPFSEVCFLPSESISPCYEPSLEFINQKQIYEPIMEINPLYRFSAIFQYLLHPDFIDFIEEEHQQFIIYMFDVIVHILAEVDLCHGMTKREFYVRQIRREMREGLYGETAKQSFLLMDDEQQLSIADEMLNVMYTGASIQSFCHIMKQIFKGCIIYQKKSNPQVIYAYVGREKTAELEKKWELVRDSFLPLDIDVRIFWELHFGILDLDVTMQADEIAIF